MCVDEHTYMDEMDEIYFYELCLLSENWNQDIF